MFIDQNFILIAVFLILFLATLSIISIRKNQNLNTELKATKKDTSFEKTFLRAKWADKVWMSAVVNITNDYCDLFISTNPNFSNYNGTWLTHVIDELKDKIKRADAGELSPCGLKSFIEEIEDEFSIVVEIYDNRTIFDKIKRTNVILQNLDTPFNDFRLPVDDQETLSIDVKLVDSYFDVIFKLDTVHYSIDELNRAAIHFINILYIMLENAGDNKIDVCETVKKAVHDVFGDSVKVNFSSFDGPATKLVLSKLYTTFQAVASDELLPIYKERDFAKWVKDSSKSEMTWTYHRNW